MDIDILSEYFSNFDFQDSGSESIDTFGDFNVTDLTDTHASPFGDSIFNENRMLEHDYSGADLQSSEFQDFDEWYYDMHGTPVEDAMTWQMQSTDFTCGIVSAEMIMKMNGIEISEAQLVFEATSAGLLSDNGMSLEGIQEILESHGVDSTIQNGSIESLIGELDRGNKIIVPLDSGEIWGTDVPYEDMMNQQADHAVVVTGINISDPDPFVVLNDPGQPNGQSFTLSLDEFKDAWNDSGNFYLSTTPRFSLES